MQEQDLPRFEATTVSKLDTFAPGFPAKNNCSVDKIKGSYSIKETEHSVIYARRVRLELGQA